MLNLHKVYLVVDKQNEAAVHIYQACGFSVEGELREEFFSNGRYRDAYRMSLLQSEYLSTYGSIPEHASVLRDWQPQIDGE
ncbi:spermidine N(1)-acetyltransferase [Bordetella holmesii 30539]|uniref:Diamine N-acetyltransferase n=2 Tax=Bordetella holmesii TaxID=35814 RepID=A0A158M7M8_9BORD|nr:spermidine N(1)-acetyltransferase [Bordetella holmesii 44057]EWM42927.1 spermidine N(1)-acetyltransferase [Bordetella holmesii 41130]EWM47877.1 spermidine N(1)-acetyltransferase [Bordetella holmesii 35009]EWM52038.1 spermidine N(1)-acetyltransferase [Bordetella holmesii 70147]EXF87329.1 spermidine N(1)-acetyltransferase [Bordetella holmesii 30539]EXX93334.1 spermidine N(1)-acetyltransferase [Bordetella holmesii 1058]KAK82338.1 diamine N-acetyltransferase [Bordetella holmesii CDC-H809-BH]K